MAERLFIVRHGETEWAAAGRHTGLTDVPLTEAGEAQARALTGKLPRLDFSLVLCSPLQRARQTCELAGFGDRAELFDDLVEWDYGDYEGLTTSEIRERDPDWDLWQGGCPGGERPDQIGARVDHVLARIGEVPGDVIAFAHGHVLRILASRWLELEVACGARFKLAPAGIGVLGFERETAALERWNA